jgi:hypothetical protein
MADLVRSAISVGRQDWAQVIEHGSLSRFEIVYRAAMIMANLTLGTARGGRAVFRKTAAYDDLDPSEIVAVDFHIGLLVAKLFAEILLDTPWVRHLDGRRPRMPRALVNENDGRRPDLVGLRLADDAGIAIEAKGRSRSVAAAAIPGAKEQVENLESFESNPVEEGVALVAYFTGSGILRVRWEDPPPEESADPADPNAPARFVDDYYRPFIEVLTDERSRVREEGDFLLTRVDEVDLTVGLHQSIFAADSPAARYGAAKRVASVVRSISDGEVHQARRRLKVRENVQGSPQAAVSDSVGTDGVFVRLGPSWPVLDRKR